jgi:hypothetical protein
MKEEDYDKIASVMPLGDVIDRLLSELRNNIQEANNQAENGSHLGMAVAIGKCNPIIDDLFNAWLSVKNK